MRGLQGRITKDQAAGTFVGEVYKIGYPLASELAQIDPRFTTVKDLTTPIGLENAISQGKYIPPNMLYLFDPNSEVAKRVKPLSQYPGAKPTYKPDKPETIHAWAYGYKLPSKLKK
jgi:hypothetical protein